MNVDSGLDLAFLPLYHDVFRLLFYLNFRQISLLFCEIDFFQQFRFFSPCFVSEFNEGDKGFGSS